MHDERPGLPVMLRVAGRRCVIVGGGAVAARRARALLAAGAGVTVVAPYIDAGLDLPGVRRVERAYEPGDLAGAFLVVVATDDDAINEAVAGEAAERGVLVNRADDAAAGDVTVMASGKAGPVTVAVDSGGGSAAAAKAMRDELLTALDPAWPALLQAVKRMRERVRQEVTDPAERSRRLRRLTDAGARAAFAAGGEAGWIDYLNLDASQPDTPPPPA